MEIVIRMDGNKKVGARFIEPHNKITKEKIY